MHGGSIGPILYFVIIIIWDFFLSKLAGRSVANKRYIRFIMGHGGGDLYRLILMAHSRCAQVA